MARRLDEIEPEPPGRPAAPLPPSSLGEQIGGQLGALTEGGIPAPATPPLPQVPANQDVSLLGADRIGDIPPPPVPPPPRLRGPGVGGIPGTEAGTLALPGSRGAAPFRTPAFSDPRRGPRFFGPGVPLVGGGPGRVDVGGPADVGAGMPLSPEEAAELLRSLVARR